MLAIYLLQQDLTNAKFLWKRIPQSVKTATPELTQIWQVGQKMWVKDFAGTYEALNKEWSETVKPFMDAVRDSHRQRSYKLVSLAYSSISSTDFATTVGLPVNDAIEAAKAQGWQYDSTTNYITPMPPGEVKDASISSEQHISRLTDFVSFLEN
jgi:COP9 signalosome complex subunit 8